MTATRHTTGSPQSALRRGYWMQLWAAVYALGQVYPQARLSAFVAVLVVVLVALIVVNSPLGGRHQ
jgi:hypothetical protein